MAVRHGIPGRLSEEDVAELDANPWMVLPTLVAAGPLEADLVLPAPGEPGPFSLADPGEALALLESCGFVAVDVGRLEGAWTFDDHAADDWKKFLCVEPVSDWPGGGTLPAMAGSSAPGGLAAGIVRSSASV